MSTTGGLALWRRWTPFEKVKYVMVIGHITIVHKHVEHLQYV